MTRLTRHSLYAASVFALGAASATLVGGGLSDLDPNDTPADFPMNPEAMERWARAMTPGEQHTSLAASSGNWRVTSTFWMDPNADPQTSEMRAVITSELGGRFIFERLTGEVMGQPFEGFGIFGYDNQKQMWTSVWVDNMNTATSYAEGKETDEGTIEMFGEMYDPMTDAVKEYKIVLWDDGPDQHYMAMFAKHEGEWTKGMEMAYRRMDRSRRGLEDTRPRGERPQGTRPQ